MIDQERIRELAEKWLSGSITSEEKHIVEEWFTEMQPGSIDWLSADSEKELKLRIFRSIIVNLERDAANEQVAKVLALSNKRKWISRLAAAAIIIILAGSSVIYLLAVNRNGSSGSAKQTAAKVIRDIQAPEITKATLTLANGTVIQLDGAKNGSIATQGNTQVLKLADGQLSYQPSEHAREMIYNVLTVPRGSQVISLTLADGTRVWLNAESSLRYPVAFGDKERKVQISGEAYFEVRKDADRKFLVESNSATTEVLGTHFNVNAYRKEKDIQVTLLEGSVKVSNSIGARTLIPGQQAGIQPGGSITLNKKADLEGVMAWKNGQFKLNNADIYTIMEQISRWYNAEVIYEGKYRPVNFGGIVSRRSSAAVLLEAMSMTGTVKFRLEKAVKKGYDGRIVVVM